jgi:ribosomal protein S14
MGMLICFLTYAKQYQFRMKALANELPGVKKASW